MSSSRDPDRPDKMHSEKEPVVRSDPRVVASETRAKEMPLLHCLLNNGTGQVPSLAVQRKKPQMKLTRASTWAAGGSGDTWEMGPGIR